MKAPQHSPSVKELVEEYGAIPDPSRKGIVGLVVGDRVIWTPVAGLVMADSYLSEALIKKDRRRRGLVPTVAAPVVTNELFAPVEAKEFMPELVVEAREEEPKCEAPIFDMGRAATDRKILGMNEEDLPEMPAWLNGAIGLATGKHTNADGEWN